MSTIGARRIKQTFWFNQIYIWAAKIYDTEWVWLFNRNDDIYFNVI